MKTFLFFFFCNLLQVLNNPTFSQSVEEYYDFVKTRYLYNRLIFDNQLIQINHKSFNERNKYKKAFIYSFVDGKKIDSLLLSEGVNSSSVLGKDIIKIKDEIFFCLSRPQVIVKLKKNGNTIIQKTFDWKVDSVFITDLVKNNFVIEKNYTVQLYNPATGEIKDVFDYRLNVDKSYKDDIGTEHPVGIGRIFAFATDNKILIKTGYNEADASFDCIYYIVNTENGVTEKLPFTHFEALIAEPKTKLKYQLNIRMDTFSIDIRNMYFDVYDSVGYIPYHFIYDFKIDANHTQSRLYPQDAFVINRDFKIIGRALERSINVAYPIYTNGKKVWNVIYGNTDSSKNCFFKIKLNYSLEKAFYNLFYNKILEAKELKAFDKYELSLLKNFIFAKHNYKFDNLFYQAYFNTFVFYYDENKRKSRTKNVDKLLTEADRKNISLITKILK